MKRRVGIYFVFVSMFCFLTACSLETAQETGNLCPDNGVDRDTTALNYVVLKTGDRCGVDSTEAACLPHRSSFVTKTCPVAYPHCSYYENAYFCGETCTGRFVACAGRCVDPLSDKKFCGADNRCQNHVICQGNDVCDNGKCVSICPENQTRCSNGCYNLMDAVDHCGECENTCLKEDVESGKCVAGKCEIQLCLSGSVNCDGNQETGCEAVVSSDANNCGTCGNVCTDLPDVLTATCVAGDCSILTCKEGLANCDADVSNGCESALDTSTLNCGICGNACSGLLNVAETTCSGGACQIISCTVGFGNCDNVASNGCETSLNESIEHCGKCESPCSVPPGTEAAACDKGSCSYTSCKSGFGDCDKSKAGCETDLTTSQNNCGSCGETCLGVANAIGKTCGNGSCGYTSCATGYTDCDANKGNGCEANLKSSSDNCGKCGEYCANFCVKGFCETCPSGFPECGDYPGRCCKNFRDCDSEGPSCFKPYD